MTIIWVDWVNGLDTNAGTNPALPKKTIASATTGRTGGDEIRVAKSPDPTPLTGTISLTDASLDVIGVGTLFTSELALGDFIECGNGYWLEVIAITSDTQITLYKKYYGDNISGFNSRKLGVTDTGSASSTTTQVQVVNSNGVGFTSVLQISGGWDLSTQTQNGETFFKQTNATFDNRYGYGLYLSSKKYVTVSKLNFLRYYNGIGCVGGNSNNFIQVTCSCNSGSGVYFSGANLCTVSSCVLDGNGGNGIYLSGGCVSSNNILRGNTTGIVVGGFYPKSISDTVIGSSTGIQLNYSYYGRIWSPTIYFCNYAIDNYAYSCENYVLGQMTGISSGSTVLRGMMSANKVNYSGGTLFSTKNDYYNHMTCINDLSGSGQSIIDTDGGTIVSQNATAGGTGREWKISVTKSTRTEDYPVSLPIARILVSANSLVTVSVYFKKSSTGIDGALRCQANQVSWNDGNSDIKTVCPNDTTRNNVSIQFTPTEDGVVVIEALAWYKSSATASVIIDDIAVTQA